MSRSALLGLALFAAACSDAIAHDAPQRRALVIGNDEYSFAPLDSPVTDAKAVATALRELGFTVSTAYNTRHDALAEAFHTFGSSLGRGDTVVIYYAGHGMQFSGRNYLLGTDTRVGSAESVAKSSLALDEAWAPLELRETGPNIIILDACRDNAYNGATTSDWVDGLAPPRDPPPNSLIAYSTSPGRKARDGGTGHSVYTRHLLESIREPGLPVEDLFSRVSERVARETFDQVPWMTTSLFSGFHFRAPVQIQFKVDQADDDAIWMVNDEMVTSWAEWRSRSRPYTLRPGRNSVHLMVYNQRSFTGGFAPFGGHQPEGWSYSASILDGTDTVIATYQDAERTPPPPSRHGALFRVLSLVLYLNPQTAELTVSDEVPRAWQP